MATPRLDVLIGQIEKLSGGSGEALGTDRQLLEDFSARHDEAAFAELVARHGPLVLRVCRRVLHHEQDAEDAFQATFLVLARGFGSIRKHEALADWLHGVAFRTAMKAKRSAARRRHHEAHLQERTRPTVASPTWDDVQAVLDEEIQRLPASFRSAFILCVLEGRTVSAAAAELGCKEGTMSSRLTRARQRLQQQLARRGIKLAALLAALCVAEGAVKAIAVPLRQTVIRNGLLMASGGTAAGAIPPHVAALATGVTRAMFLQKAKIAVLVLLTLGVFATGAGVLTQRLLQAEEKPVVTPPAVKPRTEPAKPAEDTIEVTGHVLDPDGKPVAKAKLFICDSDGKSVAPQPTTDSNGRFRFALAATPIPSSRALLATVDGLGLDWVDIRATESSRDLTLRLPAEAPIRGKVVDLEGKPVAGAAIRIVELTTTEAGTLDEFLKQWATDKEKLPTGAAFRLLTEKRLWPREALRQLSAVTTGPDGTFRLTGIGRDRGLMLGVRGPGIADHYVRVVTRPDFPAHSGGQVALSGPEVAVVVSPSKPIVGTLRDAQTKKPLAGVRVLAYTPDRPLHWWYQSVETVTDAQGRYRLDGLAKTARQIVTFDPGAGDSHMHRFDEVGDTEGLAPIIHDTELLRGVVIRGRVTDQATGRPVRARVVYAPLLNNENFNTTPGYAPPRTKLSIWVESREMVTDADGRYRLTALPGPGALFVRAVAGAGLFTQPTVAKEDRDPAIYYARGEDFLTLGLGDSFPMSHLNAYRLIRPTADVTALTADFALDPGLRRKGRLLDPDGRPLSGAEATDLTPPLGPPSPWKRPLSGAEFIAEALSPAKPRRLLFWHRDRKLAGTVVLRGDEPDPITVTLQPLAALTGRAVLKNGEPLVGYAVEYDAWPELEWPGRDKRLQREPILTDNEGRFRITDLPAGLPLMLLVIAPKTRYAVIHREKIILESGKTEDLGDLRGEPYKP